MRPSLVHQLLEESAARHPDRAAVVDSGRTLTYAELDRLANRLAHLLLDLGLARGDRVGIYLDKSLEAVVGIYAALKAGGAYVPLDPGAPPARLGYIARDCGIRILLSGEPKTAAWEGLLDAGAPLEAIVTLDSVTPRQAPAGIRIVPSSALESQNDEAPAVSIGNLDLAYILYTSGSTGSPKGVMLSHLNALTFVDWAADLLAVGPEDRLSSHAPLHFDLSTFDLFAAAHGGAPVVLVPQRTSLFPLELAAFIDETSISVWYSVPSILTALALQGGLETRPLPQLRAVLFAGEVFPTKHLRRLMALLPHAHFLNFYGPTETNVCTYYEVPPLPEDATAIPIGKAIRGVDVVALSEHGTPVDVGEVGELCVRGPSVMQGYWGDAERTATALRTLPVRDGKGKPTYHTGDLVRQDAEGDFWFLGRRDSQIKSRGYRIELGEIEIALQSHSAVVDCAVIAIPDEEISNRIAAFVVPRTRESVTQHDLARHCADRLPRYMVPEVFDLVDELPKTSTGKIDRQLLLDGLVQA
jgi:amino acid adenylation domain-containing protein